MNLHAYPRTIKDILTLNRKYIIPRFQREYSWTKIELLMFWNDILKQIKKEKSEFKTADYFIGAVVLVGNDSTDTDFLVVDGQQRLTTITILFSALAEILKTVDTALAQGCYSFVEGKDENFKPYFKLENENPKPFLQRRIQNLDKEIDQTPTNEEENSLLFAYDFLFRKLKEDQLRTEFTNNSLNVKSVEFVDLLKVIRDQVLRCKTIFITVDSLNDAQTIFETLNAKGKDLQTIDLIKNRVFNLLDEEHPTDFAKDSWKQIKNILQEREVRVNISIFLRHFWISKYEFLTEDRIYASFQEKIPESKTAYKKFLQELITSAKDYIKIISPLEVDWKEQEGKEIVYSLRALNDFRIVQHRPLVMTLMDLYTRKLLNINELRDAINQIEKFHFLFTAVSSQSASGLESTYSKFSRSLRSQSEKLAARKILKELVEKLKNKVPHIDTYRSRFENITFTDKITKDKKLIQYIFSALESKLRATSELKTFNITIEHLESQKTDAPWVAQMGNLIPLDGAINSSIGNAKFDKKLPALKMSELKQVQDFCKKYKNVKDWNDKLSTKRTKDLADLTFKMWKM